MPKENLNQFDVVIVGAGLAGLILGYQLKKCHPQLSLIILEKDSHLTGNKTWSFHHGDVAKVALWESLINHTWPRYEVQFAEHRTLETPYHTIASADFFTKMSAFFGDALRLGVNIESIEANSVKSDLGETFQAPLIFDSRPSTQLTIADMEGLGWGFQKFCGLEIKTKIPHGLKHPILMDGSVPQLEGYRFIYTLPLSETTLLVEDTRYSSTADINQDEYRREILQYSLQKGWDVDQVVRLEVGLLPIPTTKIDNATKSLEPAPLKIGYAAGLFHPITGYSLLWCLRLAERISLLSEPNAKQCGEILKALHKEHAQTQDFYLFLNRLMFHGAQPLLRYRIFQRFYQLPMNTIERFYASQTTISDRIRLLVGKPPIPILAALKVIFGGRPSPGTKNKNINSKGQN